MGKYNLALLCVDEKQAQALCVLSQSLAEIAPSVYVLGQNSYPHVTVCQFQAEPDILDNIWRKAQAVGEAPPVQAARYYWVPKPKEHGHSYVGITVNLTRELVDFQMQIMQALAPMVTGTANGYQYWPHFTLGCNKLDQNPRLVHALAMPSEVWERPIEMYLALGKSGSDGRFEEVIFQSLPQQGKISA